MQPNYQPERTPMMDPRSLLSPQSYSAVGSYPTSVHHSTVGSISGKPMDGGSLHISNKPSTDAYMERNESLQSLQNWAAPQPMMLQPNIAQTPSRRTSRMGLAESSPTLSQHFLREDGAVMGAAGGGIPGGGMPK